MRHLGGGEEGLEAEFCAKPAAHSHKAGGVDRWPGIWEPRARTNADCQIYTSLVIKNQPITVKSKETSRSCAFTNCALRRCSTKPAT